MKDITFYHSSINEPGHSDGQRVSSDKHNTRFEYNNSNTLNDRTKYNILYINNIKVDPENNKDNFETIQNTLNNLKNDFIKNANTNIDNFKLSNERKTHLQTKRTKLKFKIKKWAENDKAEEQEKLFWKELEEQLGNEKLDSKTLTEQLQSQGKAVKRFNDKRKALSDLDDLNALVGTTSRNTSLKIISKELLYKIPEKNEVQLKPDEWMKITDAIHRELFEDFDVIYSTVHMDEQSPHVHARISGKNNKTGEFDIQDQLLNKIRELCPNQLPENKKYFELSNEEVKKFGEVYQTTIFHKFNVAFQKLGYKNIKAKKRTAKQKKDDFETFKENKRPIATRQFNMQNQLLEENNKTKEDIDKNKNTNELLLESNSKLKNENKEILEKNKEIKNNNNNLIKKKNSNIKEIKETNKEIDSLKDEKNKLTTFLNKLNEDFSENFNKVYNFYKTEPFKKLVNLFNTKVLAINNYKYDEDIHNSAKYHFKSLEKNRDELLEELEKVNPDLYSQKIKEEQQEKERIKQQQEENLKQQLEEEKLEKQNKKGWFKKVTSVSKPKSNDIDKPLYKP